MAEPAGVVVDVSTACWSAELPPRGRRPPVWARLERLQEAWRAEHGSSGRMLLVADSSLGHALGGEDRRRFAELRRSGELQTAAVAAGLVLNLARQNRLHVLSADRFTGLRREHPWIDKVPERFHSWTMDGPAVRIVPADIRPVRPRAGRAESAGLDPEREHDRRILLTSWRCDAEDCPSAAGRPGHLLVWPRLDGAGRAVCPGCGGPLTELGPRLPSREMVATDLRTGAEYTRFLLEDGIPVVVGRGSTAGGVDLAPPTPAQLGSLARIGLQHLLLRLEATPGGRRLAAVDLDSGGGTAVLRGDATPRPLEPLAETTLDLADRLVLGGAVEVRASGREHPAPATGGAGRRRR